MSAIAIMLCLADEHLRSVAEVHEDNIAAVAATRASLPARETLVRIHQSISDLYGQLNKPHLPAQRSDILRMVGAQGAVVAFGMIAQPKEETAALVRRATALIREDLAGCLPDAVLRGHDATMEAVRQTLRAWRRHERETARLDERRAQAEIATVGRRLLSVAAICLLGAATKQSNAA